MTSYIKKLRMDNIHNFQDFEIEFDGKVTRLVGVNGSGKSSILSGIWIAIKGIANNDKSGQFIGDRFRFIGNSRASADAEIVVYDSETKEEITISNHITKDSNKITCSPVKDAEWLNKFLSVAFLSAKNFCSLSSKEQALLLGINTSTYDAELKRLKEEFTILGREFKAFGEIAVIEKVERVDASKLSIEKERIREKLNNTYKANKASNDKLRDEYNAKVFAEDKRKEGFNAANEKIQAFNDEAAGHRDWLRLNGYKGTEVDEWVNSLPKPDKFKPIEIKPPKYIEPEIPDDKELRMIDVKILDAATINENANKYTEYLRKVEAKQKKKEEIEANSKLQNEEIKKRLEYIKTFKFGYDELTVNEDGELMLGDRPIKEQYFSKGELEIIVTRLYTSINPELKIRFIDDFDVIDPVNQEKLINYLLKEQYQVITAEVNSDGSKPGTIILKECKIDKPEEKKEIQTSLFDMK